MSIESAQEACRRFLETDASPAAKAYYCLSAGQQMERQRDYKAALACYSLAFGLTPGRDDVWYFLHNNLGFCLNHFEKYSVKVQVIGRSISALCRIIGITQHWRPLYRSFNQEGFLSRTPSTRFPIDGCSSDALRRLTLSTIAC